MLTKMLFGSVGSSTVRDSPIGGATRDGGARLAHVEAFAAVARCQRFIVAPNLVASLETAMLDTSHAPSGE